MNKHDSEVIHKNIYEWEILHIVAVGDASRRASGLNSTPVQNHTFIEIV